MESKTARNERLRRMRQKFGLGEYKNKKAKSIKRRVPSGFMAKRVRRKSSRRSSMGLPPVVGTFAGVLGYVFFEAYVEPRIPISNPVILNVAELAVGLYMARKGGVIGNVGKAAVYINAYQLVQMFATGQSSKMATTSAFPTYN